jgi:hypothetical protein
MGSDTKLKRYQTALEKLAAEHGELSAELVVNAAKPKSSPLHDAFTWDQSKAAALYNLEEARHLIRTCYVIVHDEIEPERTVRVRKFEFAGGAYHTVDDVMRNESWRTEFMQRLARELSLLRQRYQNVAALQQYFGPIDAKLSEAEELAKKASA